MSWARYVASIGKGEVFSLFWLGGPKARDHWDDLDVGGRKTLKWTLGRCFDEVNWIQLAQDRVQQRAFANNVMNLRENKIF